MWKLKTTFSEANPLRPDDGLEQNELWVDTREEAEEWWITRTSGQTHVKRSHVMLDPDGNVVKVLFK